MNSNSTIYIVLLFAIGLFTFNSCSEEDQCITKTWYQDSDGDGFGNPANTQEACTQPNGYVSDNTDFDDTEALSFPGANEICDDNLDNNGNGEVDECFISSISGTWSDDFNNTLTITDQYLKDNNNSAVFNILAYGDNYIICKNDAANAFNANLFSKFVFTGISENNMHYCQSFYDSPSQMDIENAAKRADEGDLSAGCGGFAWGELTRL